MNSQHPKSNCDLKESEHQFLEAMQDLGNDQLESLRILCGELAGRHSPPRGPMRRVMAQICRFSQLSPAMQVLLRLCQSINHGQIEGILVVDGEPSLTSTPRILVDVKLDQDESPRPELQLPDFELPKEVRCLLRSIDRIRCGKVARLEIRGGVPRRIVFEPTTTRVLP